MRLSDHLNTENPKTHVRVKGNGYPTSNVPVGAQGTLLSVNRGEYQLQFQVSDPRKVVTETFARAGGLAMSLDVVPNTFPCIFHWKPNPPVDIWSHDQIDDQEMLDQMIDYCENGKAAIGDMPLKRPYNIEWSKE